MFRTHSPSTNFHRAAQIPTDYTVHGGAEYFGHPVCKLLPTALKFECPTDVCTTDGMALLYLNWIYLVVVISTINLPQPSGRYMYRTVVTICTAQWSLYVLPVWHSTILLSAHTVYLCVLCGSENEQRLFPYAASTDWFL